MCKRSMKTFSGNPGTKSFGVSGLLAIAFLTCQSGCALMPGRTAAEQSIQSAQRGSIERTTDVQDELEKARQLYAAGEQNSAHRVVEQAVRKNPYSVDARRLQAQICYGLGMRVESARALQAIRSLEPNSADVQHEIGLSLIRLDAHQAGLQALQRATELAPHRPEFSRDLASAHLSVGNDQAAKAVLVQAQKLNPTDHNLPVALARLYEGQKNWTRAAHYFGVAHEADSKNSTWLRQRGLAWYRSGNHEAAYHDLAGCLDQIVADADWATMLEYGDSCLKTKRYDAARKVASLLKERSLEGDTSIAQFIASIPVQPAPAKSNPATIVRSEPTIPVEVPAVVQKVASQEVKTEKLTVTPPAQPRIMRNLTLVRHDHADIVLRHANFMYEKATANAAETQPSNLSVADDSKKLASAAEDEGWTTHQREE